jgi:two-component system alkaline phosphatase synthesis response regulator PhoP
MIFGSVAPTRTTKRKSKASILIIDDTAINVEVLTDILTADGYEVSSARDGNEGLQLALETKPDLILLDLVLPQVDGLELCRRVRAYASDSYVPIIMLTGLPAQEHAGFAAGADDYVTKPFSMRELLARVKAMLRRHTNQPTTQSSNDQTTQLGEFTLDESRHEIRKRSQPLTLTPLEYNLLRFLLHHRGMTLSRETLLEKVWGYDYAGDTRTVDVHVRSLRKKIEDNPAAPRCLLTVRGIGYRLDLD